MLTAWTDARLVPIGSVRGADKTKTDNRKNCYTTYWVALRNLLNDTAHHLPLPRQPKTTALEKHAGGQRHGHHLRHTRRYC
jgi:hypothetical protein